VVPFDVIGIDPDELWSARERLVEDYIVRPTFELFNPGQTAVVDAYYDRIADEEEEE
jgi:hypothetical protein